MLLALGLPVAEAERIAVQAVLDTIPQTRMKVLRALSTGLVTGVSGLALTAGISDRKVARRAAEDLRTLGLTACPVEDSSQVDDTSEVLATRDWQLAGGYFGELVYDVLAAQQGRGGWAETEHHTPPPPQDQGM